MQSTLATNGDVSLAIFVYDPFIAGPLTSPLENQVGFDSGMINQSYIVRSTEEVVAYRIDG